MFAFVFYKQKFIYKVTEVEVNGRRSEPAGLCGWSQKASKAKEGLLGLRGKKVKGYDKERSM